MVDPQKGEPRWNNKRGFSIEVSIEVSVGVSVGVGVEVGTGALKCICNKSVFV
jgi:hypothetical protein